MKSVGEVMAIGRTFQEALCKGIRALEPSTAWRPPAEVTTALLREKLHVPGPDRLHWLFEALERGMSCKEVCELTQIDPWFIAPARGNARGGQQRRRAPRFEAARANCMLRIEALRRERRGNRQALEREVRVGARSPRTNSASRPFSSASTPAPPNSNRFTPYLYSSYEEEDESDAVDRPESHDSRQRPQPHRAGNRVRLLLLPRRVRAKEDGYETIMVNCNPETVSTDYDTSDRLYFEPLTLEDVLDVLDTRKAAGRDRAVRRADAAESRARRSSATARKSSAPIPNRSISPRIADASARCSTKCIFRSRATPRPSRRRKRSPPLPKLACPFSCARATSSAAARW